MGRYYNGDIEGKFWFGVQSSTDADFFGGCQSEQNTVSYDFSEDDLPTVKEGLDECIKKLGKDKAKLDKFFKENNMYNDEQLKKATGIKDTAEKLEWYARLKLGDKIYKCLKKTGSCSFEAEL